MAAESSSSSTLAALQAINTELARTPGLAGEASRSIDQTRSLLANTVSEAATAQASVEGSVSSARESTTQFRHELAETVAAVQSGTAEIDRLVQSQVASQATVLDDLEFRIKAVAGAGNAWSQEFARQIEAVKLGIITIDDLITRWGDAKVATEDGVFTVRELLHGLNLRQFEQQLADFITGLHRGTVEIQAVLAFLGEQELVFARRLKEVIDLFLQGKVTLEAVSRVIRGIQAAFPGTDFADLAEALGDKLQQGAFG